jgi:hypothetical protein
MSRASPHHVYVLLTATPDGISHADAVRNASAIANVPCPPVHDQTRLTFPVVILHADPLRGPGIVAALRRAGFGADYVALSEIKSGIPSRAVKSIAPALGSNDTLFMVTFWKKDEPSIGLRADTIRLFVRGKCVVTTLDPGNASRGPLAARSGMSGVAGRMAREVLDLDEDGNTAASRRFTTSELLDLHLIDGSSLRCDSSRFHFATLDKPLGYSDGENLDALTHRLASAAPKAAIDLNFGRVSVPRPLLIDLKIGVSPRGDNKTPQVFGVYSAWSASLHLRGLTPGLAAS